MEVQHIKKYLIQNLSTGILKTVINIGLTLVALPLVIKNIGINNYGVISLVLIFANFSGLLDLGLSKSLIIYNKKEDKSEGSKEVSAILILNFSIAFLIFVFSVVTFSMKFNFLGTNIDVNTQDLLLINFLALLILSVELTNNLLRAILESNFKLHWVNWGFVLQSSIINGLWLVLSYMKAPLTQFLVVPVLASLITFLYHFILCPPFIKELKIPEFVVFKRVFSTTLQFLKVGAMNSLHLPLVKYSVIYFIGDSKAIGTFELATKIGILVNNFLANLSTPLFSITSASAIDKKRSDAVWLITKKITMLIAAISIVGYGTFIFLNKWIIVLFFKEYSEVIFQTVNLTLIGFCFMTVTEGVQKYFMGLGSMNKIINYKLMSLVFNFMAILVLKLTDSLTLVSLVASYSLSLVLFSSVWILELKHKTNATI